MKRTCGSCCRTTFWPRATRWSARPPAGTAHAGAGGQEFALDLLLDLMLPDISGLEVCKAIRSQNRATPIVILTAKGEEIDKVVGLEVGADDYITKPFSMRELLARIKAAMRRSGGLPVSRLDGMRDRRKRVDFAARELRADRKAEPDAVRDGAAAVSGDAPGQPVSRARILQEVWRTEPNAETRTIDNCIKRLRAKIEPVPGSPVTSSRCTAPATSLHSPRGLRNRGPWRGCAGGAIHPINGLLPVFFGLLELFENFRRHGRRKVPGAASSSAASSSTTSCPGISGCASAIR